MPSRALTITTLLVAFGYMLIGYDNGVLGGIQDNPPFNKTFNNPDSTLLGLIAGIYDIGCFVGAVLCSFVGERLGRKKSIAVGTVVMLGGAAFQAASNNPGEIIGARIISGLGMGFINSTAPVLQNEISPPKYRGRFICFALSLLNSGIMLAYWTGYGFTPITGSKAWRVPVALQAVFILAMMALLPFAVESPRWLANHGQSEKSLKVVALIRGKATDDPAVVTEYQEILDDVRLEAEAGSSSWRELLKEDAIKSRRRLLVACSIQFFQQIGGINALIFYMGKFLALVSDEPGLIAGGVFTWFFVASFIPWLLIDSFGRRKLLLTCVSGMAIVFAIQTGLVRQVSLTGDKAAGTAATAFMFVYMGLFTIGFQAVVWVYPSEILPLRMRQKGSSISTACNWITNYIVVQIAPVGIKNIGYKLYIVFCLINASFLPFIYFFYPETAGLSLEAVDMLFAQNLHGRVSTEVEAAPNIDNKMDRDGEYIEGSKLDKSVV